MLTQAPHQGLGSAGALTLTNCLQEAFRQNKEEEKLMTQPDALNYAEYELKLKRTQFFLKIESLSY